MWGRSRRGGGGGGGGSHGGGGGGERLQNTADGTVCPSLWPLCSLCAVTAHDAYHRFCIAQDGSILDLQESLACISGCYFAIVFVIILLTFGLLIMHT